MVMCPSSKNVNYFPTPKCFLAVYFLQLAFNFIGVAIFGSKKRVTARNTADNILLKGEPGLLYFHGCPNDGKTTLILTWTSSHRRVKRVNTSFSIVTDSPGLFLYKILSIDHIFLPVAILIHKCTLFLAS